MRKYQVYSRTGFESAHATLLAAKKAAHRVADKKGSARVFELLKTGMKEVFSAKDKADRKD